MHFKSSTSYATSNENRKNRFDIPTDFLKRTGKHLNESLDTREYLEPDRRRANIEEAEGVLRGLPSVTTSYFRDTDLYDRFLKEAEANVRYKWLIDSFIKVELKAMHDVLQESFIQGWNRMNVRHYISDSSELYELIMDSADITDQATWREAIRMRLLEKLIASKRTLDKLSRVNDAYHNIVPLLNSTVTPNGSYDAIFLTGELFKSSPEINETYFRLRKHIKNVIENIDGLYHTYISYEHKIDMKHKRLNYSNGFMQASEGYDRDLGKYESLVIRQPLQRIETAKTEIENYISLGFVKKIDFLSSRTRAQYIYNKKYECWLAFNKTDTSGKIAAYLDNLKNERYVSKLYIADFLTSHSITKLVEDNKEYLSRSHELTRILWFDLAMYAESACECNRKVASIPLMQAFYAKLYDYYKTATDSERDAIIRYFYFFNINTTVSRLIDDEIPWHECYNLSIIPPPLLLNNISLQNLTSFKNGLKTYLKKTRLDGYFFRYVVVIYTLCLQRWRTVTGSTPRSRTLPVSLHNWPLIYQLVIYPKTAIALVSCLGNALDNSDVISY